MTVFSIKFGNIQVSFEIGSVFFIILLLTLAFYFIKKCFESRDYDDRIKNLEELLKLPTDENEKNICYRKLSDFIIDSYRKKR